MSPFHNKTRQASSIPAKLIRERKWHLLPVYYLMLTSELAREGIKHSGSYRFADHIYANKPKGKFLVGKLLDALLLKLPSARSLRLRYIFAKKEIQNFLSSVRHDDPIDILVVPSGLARELFEVADELRQQAHPLHQRIRWHGIDLDEGLVTILNEKKKRHGHPMEFRIGDAFSMDSYRNQKFDMIISMGLTEFLGDEQTVDFYKIARRHLKESGIFFTSGLASHRFSEYLMTNLAELHAHYRSREKIEALAKKAGFENIHTYQKDLQTIVIGSK